MATRYIAVLSQIGREFLATAPELGLFAGGPDKDQAVENLRSVIIRATYSGPRDVLIKTPLHLEEFDIVDTTQGE